MGKRERVKDEGVLLILLLSFPSQFQLIIIIVDPDNICDLVAALAACLNLRTYLLSGRRDDMR